MESSADPPTTVHGLFAQALEADGDAQTRLLDRARAIDAALASEVEELLRAHRREDSPLDEPFELPEPGSLPRLSNPSEPANGDLVGARIQGIELTRHVGTGGMGAVYEALQDRPRRRIAVKVMAGGAARGDRLVVEAEALARLDHPNVARVFGAGRTAVDGEELTWMAFEFISDARPITEAAESLSLRRRVEFGLTVARAIAHAHGKGVLHRDLKPANLLVDGETGAVKVIDFGLARLSESVDEGEQRRTRHGELLGTLRYMSPEQASGDLGVVDVRSDVYGLGVVLFELVTGELPHTIGDASILKILAAIHRGPDRRARDLAPDVDADLDAVIARALTPDPELRYPSAAALADDLEAWLEGRPVSARRPGVLRRVHLFARRRRALTLGLGAAAALLATGATAIIALAMENAARVAEIEEREEQIAGARSELSSLGESLASIVRRDANNVIELAEERGARLEGDEKKRGAVLAALEDLRRLRDLLGDDRDSLPDLAAAFARVGDLRGTYWNLDAEDAEMRHGANIDAADLWRRALASGGDGADRAREQLAVTLIKLTDACRQMDRFEEGRPYADEAVALARARVAGLGPEDSDACVALVDALFARGDLYINEKGSEQGLLDSEEALALVRTLPFGSAEHQKRRLDLEAWALLRVGHWCFRDGATAAESAAHHASSRRARGRVVQIVADSLRAHPDDDRERASLRSNLRMLWGIFASNEYRARLAANQREEIAEAAEQARPFLRLLAVAGGPGDTLVIASAYLISSLDHVEDAAKRERCLEELEAVWSAAVIEGWAPSFDDVGRCIDGYGFPRDEMADAAFARLAAHVEEAITAESEDS